MQKVIWLLLPLLLAGCISAEGIPGRADAIVCTVAYRGNVSGPIEQEHTLTFGDADEEQGLLFEELAFYAAYTTGENDNERTLRTWVTPADDAETVYGTQLYQLLLDSGPVNQFSGGHGFTGLNYAYAPQTGAELQYWCVSR